MLCIALISCVIVEESTPAHAAADLMEVGAISVDADQPGAALASDSDENAPTTPAAPQHHCCFAHCGGFTPATGGAAVLAQVSTSAPALRHTDGAPLHAPDGLERPPKPLAIA